MTCKTQRHLTDSIIMVRPVDFGFNEQTGTDNEFQHQPKGEASEIQLTASREFEQMAYQLVSKGIEVTILGKEHTQDNLPDAVFPNNWFSTREDGSLIIYPMKTPNRQAEVQVENLIEKVTSKNYQVNHLIDLRQSFDSQVALEGTGSLIFHHPSGQLFAAVSERCELSALRWFAESEKYQLHWFESQSLSGSPIYHSNVLMSCGENFAVIAQQVLVPGSQSTHAMNALNETLDDVVLISESQMSDSFCGNIIQLKNNKDIPCIVMSESAFNGFNQSQIKTLEKHGDLIICPIPTIEFVGGGSARCMIAENFLPTSA